MPMMIALYGLLPAFQVAMYLQGRPAFDLAEALNYGTSIFAFHWLTLNVALSAKVPLLQRFLPYDRRIRYHVFTSFGITLFLAYHAAYKFALGKTIDPVSWALLVIVALMLSFAVLWIPVPGLTEARKWLLARVKRSAGFSYDKSKSVHGLFALALGLLILVHVADAGLFDDAPPISAFLYLLLYGLSFGSYLVARTGLLKLGATVVGVEESGGILTIRVKPDRQHRYRSGQFAFLRVRDSSIGKEEHPFSYLSAPWEREIGFAVRASGDFTTKLTKLKAGDRLRINGGYGDFRPGKEGALCFVASGIGTVPFISILKDLHASGDTRPLYFHLAVTYEEEIPEREVLREIAASMPNLRLRVLVFSVDGIKYSADYFRSELPDPASLSYYLCSSPGVRAVILRSLSALGVKKSAIRYEAFNLG